MEVAKATNLFAQKISVDLSRNTVVSSPLALIRVSFNEATSNARSFFPTIVSHSVSFLTESPFRDNSCFLKETAGSHLKKEKSSRDNDKIIPGRI